MGATCCKEEDIDYSQGPGLEHFHLLNIIGQGGFGKVRLVQHKKSKKRYALKYIDKTLCIKQKATHKILFERSLLEQIEYPFISNLRYAFQDHDTLFMVLDYLEGGDLRYLLNQLNQLNESQVKHHVATLALSIHYLHKNRIAHRDIKPENILLDKKGYAHLTDFNMAIQFTPNQPLIWSMAGTTPYMAPEMLARKGYSTAIDWWSLGIVTFELLFGYRPFEAKSTQALTTSIIQDSFKFPDNTHHLISKECMDFITGLLDKSPFHRLGCNLDGFENFKRHPWFGDLDWDLLERKKLPLPNYKKQESRKIDQQFINNFEEDHLKSSIMKPNLRSSTDMPITEEARCRLQLEEYFDPYDFTQHLMIESDIVQEKRRGSFKRQYDRFKRKSSYQEL